jgi:hypothetical protein
MADLLRVGSLSALVGPNWGELGVAGTEPVGVIECDIVLLEPSNKELNQRLP